MKGRLDEFRPKCELSSSNVMGMKAVLFAELNAYVRT